MSTFRPLDFDENEVGADRRATFTTFQTRWRLEMSPASLILLTDVRPVTPEAAGSSPVARAMFSITYLSLAFGRIFFGRRPDTFVPGEGTQTGSGLCRIMHLSVIPPHRYRRVPCRARAPVWGDPRMRVAAWARLCRYFPRRDPYRPPPLAALFFFRSCFWELAGGHCCRTPIGGFPY